MNILEQFKNITTFVFDIDGVLTDGKVMLLPGGEQVRSMSIKDGYALQLAIKKGYRVIVISGALSEPVKIRLQKLGVTEVHMQVENKQTLLHHYMANHNLTREQVLYMGDDVPDLAVMSMAGIAACPADACPDIIRISAYISPFKGGEGCVRDIIEKVLKTRDHWSVISGLSAI